MRILAVTRRHISPVFGEDVLLKLFLKVLSKKHKVYLLVMSENKFFKVTPKKIIPSNIKTKDFDIVVLHHDSSIMTKIYALKKLHIRGSYVSLAFFIDTYSPVMKLRSIAGWFLLQPFVYFISFSKFTYIMLRRYLIRRIKYVPLIPYILQRRKHPAKINGSDDTIRLCYIGETNSDRTNPRELLLIVYRLMKESGKNVELIIVPRSESSENINETTFCLMNCKIKIRILRTLLNNTEKHRFLAKCSAAIFIAKRIRYVLPPTFIIEASLHGLPIIAPYIAHILKIEGINQVIEDVRNFLKEK